MGIKRSSMGMGLLLIACGWFVSHGFAADWVPAPSLNIPRQMFSATVDECGNIWVLGGWNRTSGCPTVAGPIFDSVEKLSWNGNNYAEQWELTSIVLPRPRWAYPSAVISNGFLYLLGGFDFFNTSTPDPIPAGTPPVAVVDRYDLLNGTWDSTAIDPLPEPRSDGAAIVDSMGRIWFIGGQVGAGTTNMSARVDIFDPARPQLGWQRGPDLNEPRARFGCTLDGNGRIVVIGGFVVGHNVQSIERIDPCEPIAWSVLPDTLPGPTTIDDQAVFGADGRLYVVGGWSTWSMFISRTDRSRLNGGSWESWSPLMLARSAHQVVLGRDGYIYAIGGAVPGAPSCNSSTSVEKLDTRQPVGDINGDGVVDALDIQLFVNKLLGQ